MTMDVEVSIVGYDRQTTSRRRTPRAPAAVPAAQAIANVPATDPDLIGAYPLDAELARQIAELANITIEPDRRLLPPETLI
jgi:hypothetical protein